MTDNPFHDTLDWALQGKYARVDAEGRTYKGWIERVHHSRGSIVMHDVTIDETESRGSVFIRTPDVVEVIKPQKRIEWRDVDDLQPFPDHNLDFEPKDDIIRSCYRNQYAKSFPVIREDGTIINGHKRIKAARVAGLDRHPVEVIDVTDEQAGELFAVAHRSQLEHSTDNADETEDSEQE
jgi:ParB family chromosome partitioning protein